ncbi:MAG: Zn-ribbon domain-containing OB-fold protein [Dehalococcoidia bacterium]|nr:MAG: Zn-ribbon domain-containing OB-fold protein [Dehalococcoidia bacterium]
MAKEITNREPMFTQGYVIMPYKYSVGSLASKFFVDLRDKKKIQAAKCPKCGFINFPPRSVCPKCFSKIEDLVELPGTGTLVTFTQVHYDSAVQAVKPPYAIGVIKMDGADTSFIHFLGDVDFKDIKAGMKLEPVFTEKRNANILDIKYFKPAGK